MESQFAARIRPTIEKALAEDPPPSLMQIAKRVRIGTLKALKKYYPNLQQKVASSKRISPGSGPTAEDGAGKSPNREPRSLPGQRCNAASNIEGYAKQRIL